MHAGPDPDLSPASAERDIGALREGVAPVRDRLSTTLFLAAAVHLLLLLGITFRAGPPAAQGTPGLDVVLLANPSPDHQLQATADRLAQVTQSGSGMGPDDRPLESGLPGLAGRDGPRDAVDAAAHVGNGSAAPVWVRAATDRGERSPATTPTTGHALPRLEATGPLWDSHLAPRPRLGGVRRELPVRPDTRESAVALYLDRWRRHVEEIGNAHYPLEAVRRGRFSGNPVLEVQLLADGTLGEVRLQHTSGVAALDRAAFGILRLAVPFEAFPPELRQRYDALRLSYEWQFSGGRLQDSGWH